MIDSHLHTRLCKHAKGDIFSFTEAAVQAGLKEIVYTDHMPLPDRFDFCHRMSFNQMETYLNWINQARIRYPEIVIYSGIEADYYQGYEEYTYQFLNRFDFDVVIMAVHFLSHWSEGNWVFNHNFPDKSKIDIYNEYLSEVMNGINTSLFDVVGHIDVIKYPGDSLAQLIPEEIEKLLLAVKKTGMAIEINTSGYRRNVSSSYPGIDWFPLLKKYNLAVTVGSDAHKPEHVAFKFKEIYDQLARYEIKKIIRFKKRIGQISS
jgi:histidinol-phosphatase (PHP family)